MRGTWVENQACVVQEAILCSAVVAISRTGGVPESTTAPHMHRFMFEPECPDQIAHILRQLLTLGASELPEIGAAGRELAQRNYDIGTQPPDTR